MKYSALPGLLLAVLVHAACSFSTPSVVLAKTERIYGCNRQGVVTERLAAFILLEDKDGRNDYKTLTLREEATGLEWTIYRENSVFLQETGIGSNTQWVGSNKFRYPRRYFPAGRYVLIASDLSGNTHEVSVSLQEAQPVLSLPFIFSLEQDRWQLTILDAAACSSFSLIMLSADLQPLTVLRLSDVKDKQNGLLKPLKEQFPDARYIQCFGENEDRSIGFLSSPIPLP